MTYNWECPHCDRAVTITGNRHSEYAHTLRTITSSGYPVLRSFFVVCPNPDCEKFTLTAALHDAYMDRNGVFSLGEKKKDWNLVPSGNAKVFPEYIPEAIRDDYGEACLIRDLSPKASATLSRRCLQGILRDFWEVKPGKLVNEIQEIKDTVDPLTWDAIDAVRKIGNIGAHMENDINIIVDVDPGEANMLIKLVETLLREWYVNRHEREVRMAAVKATAQGKQEARKPMAE